MPSKYGYEFPDGTVISADDDYALESKLLSMKSFWDRNREDCLRDGLFQEWYRNDLKLDVENMSDAGLFDYYGVRVVRSKDDGPVRFRLPDGRVVGYPNLYYWMEFEGGYPFSEWYQYIGDDYFDFEEAVRAEAEYLASGYGGEEAWKHYGIHRVPMATASSNRARSNTKPRRSSGCSKPRSAPAKRASGGAAKKKTTGSSQRKSAQPRKANGQFAKKPKGGRR